MIEVVTHEQLETSGGFPFERAIVRRLVERSGVRHVRGGMIERQGLADCDAIVYRAYVDSSTWTGRRS